MKLWHRRCLLGLGAVLVLLAPGCTWEPSIDITEKWDMPKGTLKWVEHTGVSTKGAKIKITMKATNYDVDIAVVYKENFDEAKEAIKAGREPQTYLEAFQGKSEVTITLALEANKPFVVLVRNPSTEDAAYVTLEIKGVKGPRL